MVKTVLAGSVLVALGLVAGAGLDRILASDSPAGRSGTQVNASGSPPLAHLQPANASSSSVDVSQLRAIVREELATALTAALATSDGNGRSVPVSAAMQASMPVVATSPQQQQEAMQAANDIVAGGQWGVDERMNFHQHLAMLDPAQVEQAMQNLVKAIDSGALKMSPDGGSPL